VVNSSPPPQGDVGSNFIVAEVVTSNGGKGGKGKRQRPNLNLIFLLFFLPILLSKILSLHPSFNYEIKKKSDLKKNSKVSIS
jgi:hypothetical protein